MKDKTIIKKAAPTLISTLICMSAVGFPVLAEETIPLVSSEENKSKELKNNDSSESIEASNDSTSENIDDSNNSESEGDVAQITATGEDSEWTSSNSDLDNEKLYKEYLDTVLHPNSTKASEALYQDETGKNTLSSDNYKIYKALREHLSKIASGEEASTSFNLDFSELGLKTTYTKEELGVDEILVNGNWTTEARTAFKEKMNELFDLDATVNCLLQDSPYEMYWYYKSKGSGWNYSYTAYGSVSNGKVTWNTIALTSVTFKFYVAPPYNADDTYTVIDAAGVETAKKAAANAQAIVDKYTSLSDYEKIVAYKDEILALTSYDDAAASAGSVANYNNGNPWQVIWVFDGDDSTNVVCEGYSKAFQYLCELSSFKSDKVYCYTVGGLMGSGGHMWNIIRMDDGKYYLVDLTNSDSGMVGQNGGLFLNGAASGSVEDGYTMSFNGVNIVYAYGNETIKNNLASTLTLSTTDYNAKVTSIDKNKVSFDWNYANSGFMNDIELNSNTTTTLPTNTYKRTGYAFAGWNTAMDGSGTSFKDGDSINGLIDSENEEVRLYAQWEKVDSHQVSFDWNYANSGSMPVLTGYENEELQLPKNKFSRDGYTFVGWNTAIDGSGTSYSDKDTISNLKEDTVLYAQWKKNPEVNINFDWNYANSGSMPSVTVEEGKDAQLPENEFVRDGYTFTGWNTEMDGSGTSYSDKDTISGLKENTVLYAQWKKNPEVSVNFDWNYANSGSMPSVTVEESKDAQLPENGFVRDGYTFTGWNTEMDGSGTSYLDKDTISGLKENTILYAQWEKNPSMTIRFDWNYGTSGSMPTISVVKGVDSQLPENTFEREGYVFTGWNTEMDGSGLSVDSDSTNLYEQLNGADTVLYAQWAKVE